MEVTLYLPVALQYTTLALGSLFCNSRTANPVLVGLDEPVGTKFFALWHSSNTICHQESKNMNCNIDHKNNLWCSDTKLMINK